MSITRVSLVNHVPSGEPTLSDFKVETAAAPTEASLKDGEVIVRVLYLSCDPYMRGRLTGAGDRYVASFEVGKAIDGLGVGVIEASKYDGLKSGDLVTGAGFKWESQFVSSGKPFTKLPNSNVSPDFYLGVLGMPSFTAYVGTVVLCKAKAGDTILVSSAAGAVGQIVVQLAKARGLHVVGVAGSDDKVEYVKSIGADDAFNYKTCGNFETAIKKHCPNGYSVYFDNVGGEFLDAVLSTISTFGRIAECGMISQYNATKETAYAIKNIAQIINKKLTIYGYIVSDYYSTPSYKEFIDEVSGMAQTGKIKYKVDEIVGLKNGPQALLDLFEGKNFGKRIIKVSENGRL